MSFDHELRPEAAILQMGQEGRHLASFITSQLLQISADEYLCYDWQRPERQTGGGVEGKA